MKEKLQKILKLKEDRRSSLIEKAKTTEKVEELRSINGEMETLNAELLEYRGMIEDIEKEERAAGGNGGGGSTRSDGFNPLGTYGVGQKLGAEETRKAGKHETEEYRNAFMDFVLTGKKSDVLEFRTESTTTSDIGAVIPSTILNKIVEKMKEYGLIYARVTKTSVKGGVEIPYASAKPTATWVSEGSVADKQKKSTSGSISFNYYKLQVRVSVDLIADTVALSAFEQTISDNIYEAMVIAIETAIISGTGEGQPLGITKDVGIPAAQKVSITAEEMGKYETWPALFAKMPRKYRNGTVLILNDSDWSKYIEGMVDANGQPVARVTYGLNNKEQEKLIGKDVIPTEDYLTSIDDAVSGDVIGIICKLSDYMLNTNLQMSYRKYFDEDTDEWVSKSTMIADGKLADKNGVVLIKKK